MCNINCSNPITSLCLMILVLLWPFTAWNTFRVQVGVCGFRSLEVVVEPGTFDGLQKISLQKWTEQQGEEKMREKNREMTVRLMPFLLLLCVCVCMLVYVWFFLLYVCVCVCFVIYVCRYVCVLACLLVCVCIYVCWCTVCILLCVHAFCC